MLAITKFLVAAVAYTFRIECWSYAAVMYRRVAAAASTLKLVGLQF